MNEPGIDTATPETKWRIISDEELKTLRIGSLTAAWIAMIMVNESSISVQWAMLILAGLSALITVSWKTYRDAQKKKQSLALTLFQFFFILLGLAYFILTSLGGAKLLGNHTITPLSPIWAFIVLLPFYARLEIKEKARVK
jgi:hypothetical protein